MILRAWGHLTSMSLLQWMVLCATGLVPVLLFPILPLWKTVGLFDLPISYPAYGLWTIFVLFLVPKAFREDRSRAEQSIDWKLGGPKRDIQRLKGELEQTKTDLQEQKEQLAEMDRVMRIGFSKVDVTLPPRRMSLRVSWAFDLPQAAVTHTRAGGRLVRWVKRLAHRFWEWFWG